jgi:hypothetical protein
MWKISTERRSTTKSFKVPLMLDHLDHIRLLQLENVRTPPTRLRTCRLRLHAEKRSRVLLSDQ